MYGLVNHLMEGVIQTEANYEGAFKIHVIHFHNIIHILLFIIGFIF